MISAHMIRAQMTCRIVLLALATTLAGAAHAANTSCTNGVCVTCEGTLLCVNGACTCNGTPVGASNAPAVRPRGGLCGNEPTVAHPNGGGTVSTSATVAPSVFVSSDSAVCGGSSITGATRVMGGSVVNGASSVADSTLQHAVLNGAVRVTGSRVTNSTLNGTASAVNAEVVNSVLNGTASVSGRRVQNAVINN